LENKDSFTPRLQGVGNMETNAIQTQQAGQDWMNTEVMVQRINKMHDLMKRVMKPDNHYGVIPGCRQQSLYQPGSQLLSLVFKIGHEPTVEDLSSSDEVHYRVTDRVFDQVTGQTITYGTGECSSSEDKYAWRRANVSAEFDNTPPDRRRLKYTSYNGKNQETNQVRTNPKDVANTVLKMAKKRANVNGTIEALAASELFTQDIEDLPPGMDIDNNAGRAPSSKPDVKMPQESQGQGNSAGSQAETTNPTTQGSEAPTEEQRKVGKLISEKQEKRIYGICQKAGLDVGDVKVWIKLQYKKNHLHEITWANKEYDTICSRIEGNSAEIRRFAEAAKANAAKKAAAPVATQEQAPAAPAPEADTRDKLLSTLRDLAVFKVVEDRLEDICSTEFSKSSDELTEKEIQSMIEIVRGM
jgi:hypothetical protein